MLYRYRLSGYVISEVLGKRFEIKVSLRTVCKWARKFGDVKHILKHLGIFFSRIWHMNEMFIKARRRAYYHAVIDDRSNVIALHISDKRDMQSAIECLRKAKHIAGRPEIIVTDRWQAYPRVIRKVFGWRRPKVKHVVSHFERKKGNLYTITEGSML
jgi:transposase-like protein